MVLSPPKPGEPPCKLAKVTKTESGHSVSILKYLTIEEHTPLKELCLRIEYLLSTSQIFYVMLDNFQELCVLLKDMSSKRPALQNEVIQRPIYRCVLNTVSSFRMFADHLDREAKHNLGEKAADNLRKALNSEYDASFSYRLSYQLRNHAAHLGFPSLSAQIRSSLHPDDHKFSIKNTNNDGSYVSILVSVIRDKLLGVIVKSGVSKIL